MRFESSSGINHDSCQGYLKNDLITSIIGGFKSTIKAFAVDWSKVNATWFQISIYNEIQKVNAIGFLEGMSAFRWRLLPKCVFDLEVI